VNAGHAGVIQQLTRRGFYLADIDDDDVENLLMSDLLHHVSILPAIVVFLISGKCHENDLKSRNCPGKNPVTENCFIVNFTFVATPVFSSIVVQMVHICDALYRVIILLLLFYYIIKPLP